jgi:hypothetical protein
VAEPRDPEEYRDKSGEKSQLKLLDDRVWRGISVPFVGVWTTSGSGLLALGRIAEVERLHPIAGSS